MNSRPEIINVLKHVGKRQPAETGFMYPLSNSFDGFVRVISLGLGRAGSGQTYH